MKLTHRQVLNAPLDDVWANFMDLHRIGQAFPGAAVTEVDGDDFVGNVRARLGPFTMTFDGTGSMTERDVDQRRAHLEAQGKERHGLGNATIAVSVTLTSTTARETDAHLVTELVFVNAPMNFGTGLVQRASDPLVERFLIRMAGDGAPADEDSDALDIMRSAADLFGSFTGRKRKR